MGDLGDRAGDLGGREAVRLDGARPGDRVAIIGDVGWSAAGYALLRNDIDGFDTLRRRHLVPKPPYGQGRVASEAGATSMTDVSDGLVADLGHIARASEVGIDLSTDSLRADHDPLTEAAAAAATDPWGGCSAEARITRWSRRSLALCPRVGGRSGGCSMARRAYWSTASNGADTRVGSRSECRRTLS